MASLKKYKHIPKALVSTLALPFTYGMRHVQHVPQKHTYTQQSNKKYSARTVFNSFIKYTGEIIGSLGGLSAGSILGTYLIPVPILGTVIGAAIGLFAGAVIGNSISSKLNTKTLRTYLTELALVIGGAAGMWKGGVIGSFIGQTVIPIPGVGAGIGFVVGAFAGLFIVGGLASSVVSFTAKHLSRLVTAIFNYDAVNPTNPAKYQVIPQGELVSYGKAKKKLVKAEGEEGAELIQDDRKLDQRNIELERCYTWQKQEFRVKVAGLHIPVPKLFWTDEQRVARKSFNDIVLRIHTAPADKLPSPKDVEQDLEALRPQLKNA